MGDRIAVLRDGELQEQVGTPEELYERPANVFVGGFIGSPGMSFLPGDDGRQVGVRPEHVRPWQDGLHGPIEVASPTWALGRETLVGVDADDTRLVAVFEGRADLEVGAPLRVGLVPAGMQRFGANGLRSPDPRYAEPRRAGTKGGVMDHIAVNPAALTGASGVQGALAADLLAVSGLIQAAGAQAAGACGEPSASAAVGAGSADLETRSPSLRPRCRAWPRTSALPRTSTR